MLSFGFGPWSLVTCLPCALVFVHSLPWRLSFDCSLSRSCEVDEDAVFWTDELIGCLAVELRSTTFVTGVELRFGFPGRDSIQSYFGHLCQELTSGWDRTRLRTLLIGDFYRVVAFASEPVACVFCLSANAYVYLLYILGIYGGERASPAHALCLHK